MDSLSVLVPTKAPWEQFVEQVTRIVGVDGECDSDEFGERHVWNVVEIELIGINQTDLEYNQGIQFSKFNCQLRLISTNLDCHEESERFYNAFGRYIYVRLKNSLKGDIRLVRNLQTLVSIEIENGP